MDKQAQMAEREARQRSIDETIVDPVWAPKIEVPLIELSLTAEQHPSPNILMPELRFKSLLKCLLESFDHMVKLMVVDATNARFEALRTCAQDHHVNLYFSTQDIAQLNYAEEIFHLILTEIGLSTLFRLDAVLTSYARVLRTGGQFVFSVPVEGSFQQFIDMFDECLFRYSPKAAQAQKTLFENSMKPQSIANTLKTHGFHIENQDVIEFELTFQNAEQLLFSSLIEAHCLGYCLYMREPDVDSKMLLTNIVRSFHHYFQGESITVPMKVGVFSTTKKAAS